MPILLLAQRLRGIPAGDEVILLATDPAVEPDLHAFCQATGHSLESFASVDTIFRARIRKASPQEQ